MRLSTRTRYGVRLLFELALNYGKKESVLLKEISEKQGISEKYLGNIILSLKAANLVVSYRGSHGGYSLACEPESITIKDIVELLEGESKIVDCLSNDLCDKMDTCPSQDLWRRLDFVISDFLSKVTLKDLVKDYYKKIEKYSCMYYI